eukprot:IDg4101t1
MTAAFSELSEPLTGKKCADRFNKLIKEHWASQKPRENMTGTDDEDAGTDVEIMDDICEVHDDTREEHDAGAAKKRSAETGLMEAGKRMRNTAMASGSKKARTAGEDEDDENYLQLVKREATNALHLQLEVLLQALLNHPGDEASVIVPRRTKKN